MKVKINGDAQDIPDGLTVSALLEHLAMPVNRIAVERNLEILPRAKWAETRVAANDSYEIVHFVGGGSAAL
jgi:sulfur carrier protein